MRGPTYSEAQLTALRESPLVKKPDSLPSISQWMDVPAESNTGNAHTNNTGAVRRTRGLRDSEGVASNDQRPLINPMGQFGRRQSMQPGEDTVLGPPKLAFVSASRTAAKAAGDSKERTGITSTDGDNLGDRFPREKNERWTRDRDTDRVRDRAHANGRRGAREDGEGWTSVKGRRSIGQEDFERFGGRNNDRNRDKHEGDPELESGPRRGNRDRPEQRWGRRDDAREEGSKGVQGGWRDRDREREREREKDRDWTRGAGNSKAEEDPEWMDTKVEKKEFKPRTQEDFQRWKEQMKAKEAPADDKDGSRDDETLPTAATVPPMLTAPVHTPSAAEPTQGILFGNWGKDKSADITPVETITKPKADKKSRFMTMFAKPEEQAMPDHAPVPAASSPAPMLEGNADKEGFQRILQMLGGVNVSGPPSSQPNMPTPTNGARHGGGVSLDFQQQQVMPEPQPNKMPPRTQEQQSMLDEILAPRPSGMDSRNLQQMKFNSMSPENVPPESFRPPRPDSGHPEDHYPQQQQQPPSRNSNPQDANLAALLNSRNRDDRDQATKQRERDFLLNLMQQPSRATPPNLAGQNLPRPMQDNPNMSFYDQPRQVPQQQQQQKNRGPMPPGFMEDPRMFSENDMMRREAERREQEMRQQMSMQQLQQEAMRQKNARMPPSFPGHDDGMMGIQRRNTAGDPRLTTNMGIPSQPVPDMPYMGGRGQPGMPPTPQERPNIAPPPGFGGPMRQPPGLSGPSFSAGNTPLGHPPGFLPPGSMGRMGFPGGPGGPGGPPNGSGMQGPPQGYFPPPGYGPPMPGMRGEDPRMMFDGQFGGPAPRQQQQGRPGPPNMY